MGRPGLFKKDRLLLAIGIAAAASAVLPMLGNDLVWDDRFIVEGLIKLDSQGGFSKIFTQSFWRTSTYLAIVGQPMLWRPLTSVVLWAGGLIFGYSAPGFHLISILAMGGCAAVFYALLKRLFARAGEEIPMAWVALVFIAHPMATEVACLVSNVSDHLAFMLLGAQLILYCDLLCGRRKARSALALAALAGFAACAAKELGVISIATPLAAYLFCIGIPGASIDRRQLRSVFFWLCAALPAIGFLVLRSFVVEGTTALSKDLSGTFTVLGFAWGQLIVRAAAPVPVGTYTEGAMGDWQSLAGLFTGVALIVSAFYFSIRIRRKPTFLLMGVLVALALLAPSLLAIAPRPDAITVPTRYFHLPLAGLLIAAAPAVSILWPRPTFKAAMPLVVVMLALLSFVRVREWSDRVTLWTAEIHYHPGATFPKLNLAGAMVARQAFTQAEKVLEDAEHKPGIHPFYVSQIYGIRAEIARKRDGDLERATRLLEKALALTPQSLDLVDDLALTRAQAGRLDQAIRILQEALGSSLFSEQQRRQIEKRIAHYKGHMDREKPGS